MLDEAGAMHTSYLPKNSLMPSLSPVRYLGFEPMISRFDVRTLCLQNAGLTREILKVPKDLKIVPLQITSNELRNKQPPPLIDILFSSPPG
jgi:hypothetical protein